MKFIRWFAILTACGALLAMPTRAQQVPTVQANPAAKEMKLLRLQITFTDYDGDKKIDSLPYVLHLGAYDDPNRKSGDAENNEVTKMKFGLRIPVATGGAAGGKDLQFQYIDVGTNLYLRVENVHDGLYTIDISADRSMATGPTADALAHKGLALGSAGESLGAEPVIQQFTVDIPVELRDGQTTTSVIGTDPIGGHVLKMEVTLNEEK